MIHVLYTWDSIYPMILLERKEKKRECEFHSPLASRFLGGIDC